MTDKKISELTPLTGANAALDDLLPIVDVSAVETKSITRGEFFLNLPSFSTIDINGELLMEQLSGLLPLLQ